MKKTRMEKGITLVALIITIVVLLILAAISINAIQNDEIIGQAQGAVEKYGESTQNEQDVLEKYINCLDNSNLENATLTVTTAKNKILSITSNTDVIDEYGNKIVVPARFKIRVDDTTNNADTVTEGIVIEDEIGNQFVWIPVGKIYTDVAKTEENVKTIVLGRYSWAGSTGILKQPTANNPYTQNIKIDTYFTEYQPTSGTSNSKARNINDFYESIMGISEKQGNAGYYIGRYEAGDSSNTEISLRTGTNGTSTTGTLVCKANQVPYNWIIQSDASNKCKNMYADGYKNDGTGTFSSDLINSYAWDTAIIFIETFGNKSNSSSYRKTLGKSSIDINLPQMTGTNMLKTTGTIDEQLNIYDMAGNCEEWTTTTSSYSTRYPCSARGGYYSHDQSFASAAGVSGTTYSNTELAFRPILYLGL